MTEESTMQPIPSTNDLSQDTHADALLRLYPEDYDRFHRTEYRPDTPYREVQLSQMDYERFRAFVLETIGLDYPEEKRYLLGWGLSRVMEAASCSNLDQLYHLLRSSAPTSHVWDRLIGALTVGETYFFRNSKHFDALAKHVLPTIMAQRETYDRRIRIWSAGCATGEEPYSIAILLHELIPDLKRWNISILATDVNREALRKAQEGIYAAWSFRGVDPHIQESYFRPMDDKQFALSDKIKKMVTFEYLNLVTDPYPSLTNHTNARDLILCRNVTIYFEAEVTRRVLASFHACLTDGGWLIPGAAEPNMIFYDAFKQWNLLGGVLYQKASAHKNSFVVAFQPVAVASAGSAAMASSIRPIAEAIAHPLVKPPPSRDPYQVAVELLREGKADEALAHLHEKLDQDASFAPAYYTIGKIYANQGNLAAAQEWCEKAIKEDKLHPEPYYTLSLVYEQNGLIDQAIDALKKAVYLNRRFVLAHYNLGQLYRSQGDQLAARRSLQNVVSLLKDKPKEELVPEGDGLVVGRLLELAQEALELDG
jgi:chemotaxis protein methyltransferase CheR